MNVRVIIGHRGASAHAPENTLQAYELAWKMGADMVELDVQQTRDGQLVCIHDYDVSRTSDGEGMVSELTFEQIRMLDFGGGEKIPLLSDALELAQDRFGINIELKVPDIELDVLRLVKEFDMISDVIFSSFLHATLGVVRAHSGNAVTAVLLNEQMEDSVRYAQNLSADAINPLFFTLSPELVESAHNSGMKVYPWTVNEPEFMREMLRMGADGIITDFPDIAVDVVDSLIVSGELQ